MRRARGHDNLDVRMLIANFAQHMGQQIDEGGRASAKMYAAGGPVATSPAVVNGILYVTAGPVGRTLYAFDAAGGASCSGARRSTPPAFRSAGSNRSTSPRPTNVGPSGECTPSR